MTELLKQIFEENLAECTQLPPKADEYLLLGGRPVQWQFSYPNQALLQESTREQLFNHMLADVSAMAGVCEMLQIMCKEMADAYGEACFEKLPE